jgi:hypothetical protein
VREYERAEQNDSAGDRPEEKKAAPNKKYDIFDRFKKKSSQK